MPCCVPATHLINAQLSDRRYHIAPLICEQSLPGSQLTQVADFAHSKKCVLVTGSMAASVSSPVSPQRDSHVDRNQWTAESGSGEVMAGTGMWVTGAVMRKSWALPGPGRTVEREVSCSGGP